MEKRTSRRSIYGKSDEEQKTKEVVDEKGTYGYKKNCDTNGLIADMAQGFIQAQAKVSNNTSSVSNKDIISLLEQLNSNLEEIKSSSDKINNQSSSKKATTQQDETESSTKDDNKKQDDKELLKELKNLVSTMLQGNNSEDSSLKSQSNDTKKSDMKQQQQDSMAAQTVSQVLAQTQYELANELENSLQKLKEVISKSEKVATNISHLLSKENIKKS
jgi:ATP-dependent exoDNAse (exonuclease V) beta subunit